MESSRLKKCCSFAPKIKDFATGVLCVVYGTLILLFKISYLHSYFKGYEELAFELQNVCIFMPSFSIFNTNHKN